LPWPGGGIYFNTLYSARRFAMGLIRKVLKYGEEALQCSSCRQGIEPPKQKDIFGDSYYLKPGEEYDEVLCWRCEQVQRATLHVWLSSITDALFWILALFSPNSIVLSEWMGVFAFGVFVSGIWLLTTSHVVATGGGLRKASAGWGVFCGVLITCFFLHSERYFPD
jgi:hypothetical protein